MIQDLRDHFATLVMAVLAAERGSALLVDYLEQIGGLAVLARITAFVLRAVS